MTRGTKVVSSVRSLEEGDVVVFDHDALSGREYRVSSIAIEDIGITETFAVTFVCDREGTLNYVATGTTSDSAFTLEAVDGDDEHRVFWMQVEHQNT